MWWHPDKFAENRPFLEKRAAMTRAVRDFFDSRDFQEVETPILQVCPVMDTHIHAFRTEVHGPDMQRQRDLYLHTSPEFAMKKLMVAGLPRLYQLCHVFRNGEGSHRHSLEFTMLEWCRAPGTYRDIMADCEGLLRHVCATTGTKQLRYGGLESDAFGEWTYLSVCEAFGKYAGIRLEDFLPDDAEGFAEAVKKSGLRVAAGDTWDDLFFRVMAEKIEPHLGHPAPCILYDYPVSMASLARRKPGDPRFAERFEMYVCGLELCNAFSELTDVEEQRRRFHEAMAIKTELYGAAYPVDEDFLRALEYGLPESGGNALGMDRLAMLVTGAADIAQVLWAGKP